MSAPENTSFVQAAPAVSANELTGSETEQWLFNVFWKTQHGLSGLSASFGESAQRKEFSRNLHVHVASRKHLPIPPVPHQQCVWQMFVYIWQDNKRGQSRHQLAVAYFRALKYDFCNRRGSCNCNAQRQHMQQAVPEAEAAKAE